MLTNMNTKLLLGKSAISKYLLVMFAVCLSLIGCRADVDLNNIDTTSEVELGVALPIGSMSVALSDILGANSPEMLYFRNDGVLCLHYDYDRFEDFHAIDFTQYISNAEQTVYVYDSLNAQMERLRAEKTEKEQKLEQAREFITESLDNWITKIFEKEK